MALIRPIPTASAEMKEMLIAYMAYGTGAYNFFTNGTTSSAAIQDADVNTSSEYMTKSTTSIVAKKACKARVYFGNVGSNTSTYTEVDAAAGDTIITLPYTTGTNYICSVEIL